MIYIMISACPEQAHFYYNTFNVLANEGFLRDTQGILTLESVLMFYESIKQERKWATLETPDFIYEICNKLGDYKLNPQPVISVTQRRKEYNKKKDKEEWQYYFHNFAVKRYMRSDDRLDFITDEDEKVECLICPKDDEDEILWSQMTPEKWYLEDHTCYYFVLN